MLQKLFTATDINFLFDFLIDQNILATTDNQGNITYANDKFCQISGYSREELTGQNHRLLKSGIHGKEFYQSLWGTITKGETWQGEVCNKAKDGSLYWSDTIIKPKINQLGQLEKYYIFRFLITEKKRLELTLKSERDIFIGGSSIAFRRKNKIGLPIDYVSPNISRQFGYKQTELSNDFPFESLIHPDDLPNVKRNILDLIHGLQDSHEVEYRLKNYEGNYHWVKDLSVVERDIDSRVIYIYGYLNCITEIKQKTIDLNNQIERFDLLLESIPDCIILKDPEGKWLVTNDAARLLFRLNNLDWKGNDDDGLFRISPFHDSVIQTCKLNDQKAWKEKKILYEHETFMSYDNKESNYLTIRRPIFNADGSPKAMLYIGRDITSECHSRKLINEMDQKLNIIGWKQSHEVRAPVARLSGLLQLIEVDPDKNEHPNYLNMIKESCRELEEIIKSIVDITNPMPLYAPSSMRDKS